MGSCDAPCLGLNPNGTQTSNDHHRLRPCQHHGSGPRYPRRGPETGGLHHDPLRKEIRHQHANREELRTVLDFLRKGDVLMVTRIDRLARASATCRISFKRCEPRAPL
jgi:hypothetical protein